MIQLNFRFFLKKIFRFSEKKKFKNRNFFFSKNGKFELVQKKLSRRFEHWETSKSTISCFFFCFSGPMSQKARNLRFGGLLVVQSAYKTFLTQLKFSIFFEKKISIFWKFFFKNRNFFFPKNRNFELAQNFFIGQIDHWKASKS